MKIRQDKAQDQKGFQPLPKRWAMQRTFGWLAVHRRLARDYETPPNRPRTMIHYVMIHNMSRRLTGESTPTWRINAPTHGIPV
jgi:transposase